LVMAMLFVFALMSKIMVVTLPFAMVLLDYWPLGRIQPTTNSRGDSGESSTEPFFAGLKRSLVEKIPLVAMSAAAALVTLRIHRNEGALTSAMLSVWRLKNALFSYLMYLGKAVWPVNLAVFYPHPENSLRWWQVAAAPAMLVAITALVWRYRERRYLVVG